MDEKMQHYLDTFGDKAEQVALCDARDCIDNTGFSYTMSLISGKYKMLILYTIAQFETIRFNEMQRYIRDISYKTLSAHLKELERDDLIVRHEYPQIPPKVEYSLSERGKTLIPVLSFMCAWGYANK